MDMKKYLFLVPLVIAASVSCSKETPAEDTAGAPANQVYYVDEGISIIAKAEVTKVTVTPVGEEGSYTGSQMAWEAGDQIKVYHNGKIANFVTETAGTTATFKPVTPGDVIFSVDMGKPMIAYYNVSSVAVDGKATFSIAANQTEGTASNKVPLYAYSATPAMDENCVSLTFTALASVLEFKVSAAPASALDGFTYNLTKVVLTPKTGATGWTAMTSGTVNPATGEITSDSQSLSALTYNFAASTDIVGGKHFQLVAGACRMNNSGATMDWYKGEIQNYTKDIWASKDINLVAERAHKYQPIAEKVVGLANYNDYYTKFYANRNSQGNLINYCDDERAMILTGDIYMVSGDSHRVVTIPNLSWNVDGKGHSIFAFNVTDAKRVICFFSGVQADIKNLNFGRPNYPAIFNISDNNAGGSYAPISDLISGTLENITSYIDWTLTVNSTDKACNLGGIVGNMKGGTIRNCYNRGSLTLNVTDATSANMLVGGLVGTSGTSYCTIADSQNYADVSLTASSSASVFVAGIVSTNWNGSTISGCENHGDISLTNTNTTDQSSVNTAQCRASGIVSNYSSSYTHTLNNCTNDGDITASLAAKVKSYQVAGIACNFLTPSTSTGCVQRGNVYARIDGEFDNTAACWFAQYSTGTITSASVLLGTYVNGTAITSSNYANRNIWSRADNPGTLTYITE